MKRTNNISPLRITKTTGFRFDHSEVCIPTGRCVVCGRVTCYGCRTKHDFERGADLCMICSGIYHPNDIKLHDH